MPSSNNIQSSFNASVLHALWSTLMSVATSLRLQRKTKKSGTRKRKRHEIVYVLSERLEQATFMPTSFPGFSPIRPTKKERTLGTRLPSWLQQGWGNNVFYNKLSHVLTHSHFQSNYPVVMLVFAPAVSDIFHHFTFLLTGMFIWGTISVQGRTDPLETQLYIRTALQMSGVPLLL